MEALAAATAGLDTLAALTLPTPMSMHSALTRSSYGTSAAVLASALRSACPQRARQVSAHLTHTIGFSCSLVCSHLEPLAAASSELALRFPSFATPTLTRLQEPGMQPELQLVYRRCLLGLECTCRLSHGCSERGVQQAARPQP